MTRPALVLPEERLRRWGMDRPPLRTAEEAAAYVDDLGFVLLLADRDGSFPALREAARDDESPMLAAGWTEDFDRMWTWKDELPTQGSAWVGRFVANRQSLLSVDLLALLRPDEPGEEAAVAALSPVSRRVYAHLQAEGPTSTRVLRQVLGLDGKAAQRFLAELGHALLVTNYGTRTDGPGWPSCVLEVTGRAFPDRDTRPADERHRAAGLRFLRTMVSAEPGRLAQAFRWPRRQATAVLRELVDQGAAQVDPAGAYRLSGIEERR